MRGLILILMWSLAPGAFAATSGGPRPGCEANLADPFDLPAGWGISPVELKSIAGGVPEAADALKHFARLARFISREGDEFFEIFGTYFNAGILREVPRRDEARTDRSKGLAHRHLQITELQQAFIDRGILPDDLGPTGMALITDAYGPLSTLTRAADPTTGDLQLALRRALIKYPFRFQNLVKHSASVQAFVLAQVRDPNDPVVGSASEVSAWQRRLAASGEIELNPRLVALVNRAEAFVRQEALPGRLNILGQVPAGSSPAATRKFIEAEQSGLAITAIWNRFFERIAKLESALGQANFDDRFLRVAVFDRFVQGDTFIDQGLNPILRRIYTEVNLNTPTLTAADTKARLSVALKQRLSGLRSAWREIEGASRERARKAEAARSVRSARAEARGVIQLPNRAERVSAYERILSATLATAAPAAPEPSPRASTPAPVEAAREAWDDLLERRRPLAEAREDFARVVKADEVQRLRIRRTGFNYRVELSQTLIDQLTAPAPGEPEDLRAWLSALVEGPARAHGESGWKKFEVPVKGFSWEIKLTGEPYRILGVRKPTGVWRFERIERMH